MPRNRIRAVQERRRSNAAGPHTAERTRADELAAALVDWNDEPNSDFQDPASSTTQNEGPEHQHHNDTSTS